MGGANRSLRRKPPPETEVYDTEFTARIIPEGTALPLIPFSTPEKIPAPFQLSFKARPQISLTANPDLSYDSGYAHDNDEYMDYNDEYMDYNGFAEDLLLSYESPRLKGPQDLPFDEDGLEFPSPINAHTLASDHSASEPASPLLSRKHTEYLAPLGNASMPVLEEVKHGDSSELLSHKTHSYRQRKFQNLLQKGTSPCQIHESEVDEERDYFPHQPLVHTSLPKQLPYPLEDQFSSEEEGTATDFEYSASNGMERMSAAMDITRTTPTRIPSLVEKNSMQILARPSLPHKKSLPDFRFIRNSPPRLLALPSTSPELHLYNYLSSPLSSPTRASLYGRLPQMYSSVFGDTRSSRSPSPKKYIGTSPPSKTGFSPYDENTLGVFEDYYDQERVPRWSLIENGEDDDYDDSFIMPPAATQFDYTILPELPSLAEDSLHESVFGSLQQNGTSQLQPTLTTRRKNEALPPVPLDLPLLPFLPSILTSLHFSACPNVWSLSHIFLWCVQLKGWMHGDTLSLKDFRKVLMKLTAFHKQDVPIDIINRNVSRIIDSFTEDKLLVFELGSTSEEKQKPLQFLFDENGSTSGVLVELTSCYCKDNDHKQTGGREFSVKCYSSQCLINKTIEHEHLMRTTNINELVLGDDWASHWKLAAQDMAIDLSESRRQSFLFDIIKFEQNFIQRAECFVDIAGPEFIKLAKLVVGSSSLTSLREFGGKIMNAATELLSIHRKSLYEPLLKILVTDGKFIKNLNGIAELYIAWAKAAKSPLLSYISAMPMIEDLLRNSALKTWDELIRLNPRIKELQVNGNLLLISTFNSRYQQLPLQLMDVRKFFDEEDEEYVSLTKAVEAIRQLGNKVNEMKVYSDNIHALRLVEKQLAWKSSVFQPHLNLKSSKRKFFFRGDLIRKGDLKINSHSVHVIVLDNFILITDKQRIQRSNNYKVTETPIPLDYLIVENRERESYGLSVKTSPVNTSNNNGDGAEDESSSFPFKIRYAGRKGESHTLIASTEKERRKWIATLMQAKSNLLKRVLPTTPYSFELVENGFFSYDHASRMTKLPIFCSTDPISVLAKKTPASGLNIPPVQRHVQCSEMFSFRNENFIFLGTNAGVYCSDRRNKWKKIINMNNVAKVTVISELNIVLVLASRTLRYYPLQLLVNIYYEKKDKITSYQLSNEGILFFEFGCHRGLPMLFVAKKKTAATTSFKVYVLELDNNGIFSTFTILKRFYIQAECHGISVFNSSVAVHTQRGFEVLDLQKLTPRSVPEIPATDASSKKLDGYSRKKAVQSTDIVKKVISHASSMGMFKLSNNKEFLMVYSECAIFVNKSGKLSRASIVHFDFKPKSIAFMDDNLVLVCEEVIEVWSISISAEGTNKLIQVIPSKGLHLLDPRTLCFNLANPENSDLQLIFRMLPKPESPLLA